MPSSFSQSHLGILCLKQGLVSGTKYRGDFEKKMKAMMDYLQKNEKIILFVDEIHTIIGAGSASGGALDASNLLKPALARGLVLVLVDLRHLMPHLKLILHQ